jgi:hypothetical protein
LPGPEGGSGSQRWLFVGFWRGEERRGEERRGEERRGEEEMSVYVLLYHQLIICVHESAL